MPKKKTVFMLISKVMNVLKFKNLLFIMFLV